MNVIYNEGEISCFVCAERKKGTTYKQIIDLAIRNFKVNITRWDVYKYSRLEQKSDLTNSENTNSMNKQKIANNVYNEISKEVVRLRNEENVKYVDIIDIIKKEFGREISRGFIYSRVKKNKQIQSKKTEVNQKPNGKHKVRPVFSYDYPSCGCKGIVVMDKTTGDTVCSDCGIVIDSRVIDMGQDWRAWTHEDRNKKARTGSPMMVSSFDGLSTDFNPYGNDGRGVPLSARSKSTFKRMHKWNTRNRMADSHRRNFSRAFNELDKICSQLHLPHSIKERAAHIYRKIKSASLSNGCSINGMIAACVYAACRMLGNPISQDEIALISLLKDMKELRTCFKRILKLSIKIPTVTPELLVPKYCSKLKLPQKTASVVMKLINVAADRGITVGKNPIGIVAASIYIVNKSNNMGYSQKEISNACNVTEVTIRNRCIELIENFEFAAA